MDGENSNFAGCDTLVAGEMPNDDLVLDILADLETLFLENGNE